jgi:hypothetical protein
MRSIRPISWTRTVSWVIMKTPPRVACLDTRHPRRLFASGQASTLFLLIYDQPSFSSFEGYAHPPRGVRCTRCMHRGGAYALRSAPQKKEQESMSTEDNGPNLEELARRMEALERENRELREALGSRAPDRELETHQQRPQATQAKEVTVASSKTVRGLLLGPRDEQAYARPLARVLPSYVVGWLLTCAVGAYGTYIALFVTVAPHSEGTHWLGLASIAALFFGVYGGIRDGSKFVFARFQYVGLITAIGTTVVVFLVSLGIMHQSYGGKFEDLGFTLERLLMTESLFPIGAVFVSTWLLFVSGALLGTALQLWASEKERAGREGSIQGSSGEGVSASTSSVRAQVWLGFAGTVLAALIALVGTLIGGQ